jgi:multiple sugar transport system permease protein
VLIYIHKEQELDEITRRYPAAHYILIDDKIRILAAVKLLRPTFATVVVLGTIGTFQIFDQVSIITQGGPLGTTQVPAYYIYQKTLGMNTNPEAGYAAAMAFILTIIIVLCTLLQRRYIDQS